MSPVATALAAAFSLLPIVSTLRRAVILYEFQFETGSVDAEAEFVLSREDGSGLVLKFAWVVIRDPAAGDVTFPGWAVNPDVQGAGSGPAP